jgi:hypothetical protein
MTRPRSTPLIVLLASVGVLACASGEGGEGTTFATWSSVTLGETDEDAPEEDSSDATSGEGDDGLKLDVAGGGAAEGAADDGSSANMGCEKVDLILSIDASSSMQAEIDSLYDTFLEVETTLANEVGEGIEDFHVGVMNACNSPPFLHNWGANRTDCEFPNGQNWLDSADPLLNMHFECVIDIPFPDEALDGNGGDNGGYGGTPDYCKGEFDEDEQPALAAAAAIQPDVAENVGMIRDDAILLVVAITDEDEALANVGSPGEIHDSFMAAKEPGEVVFLGIGGTSCSSAYDGGHVGDSKNLAAVAAEFGEFGLFRTMCAGPSEDPIRDAFQEALSTLVDEACDGFIPPE